MKYHIKKLVAIWRVSRGSHGFIMAQESFYFMDFEGARHFVWEQLQ